MCLAMSSSILERLRLNHESAERFEDAIGQELDVKPQGQKVGFLNFLNCRAQIHIPVSLLTCSPSITLSC